MYKNLKKGTIIYVGDPLCSWCYGFSDEISLVKEQMSDSFNFSLINGGLRPYNTETMKDLGDFLKGHWEEVSKRTGQKFNYDILKDTNFVYDTEPPARAVVVARDMKPEIELEFFKAVQIAFYFENKNTHKVETYLEIAKKFELNTTIFQTKFESEEYKEKVKNDFLNAQKLGVQGFPAVLLLYNNTIYPIANGYEKADKMIKKINGFVN